MAIHKCRRCVWSNKINSNLLYCIFPRCIIKEKIATGVSTANGTVVGPKARTNCDDKKKRRVRKQIHSKVGEVIAKQSLKNL